MRDQLLAWLDAGAPEGSPQFRMDWGLGEITEPGSGSELNCGTVCCIAGFVALHAGLAPWENQSAPWEDIELRALNLLGLPHIQDHLGHPLFDPSLAPYDCAPAQAAIAARFAFANPEHPDPWEATYDAE